MAGARFAFFFLVVFLTGELSATVDDFCTDQSYYDVIQYTTRTKQCCKPKLQHSCESKIEQVCKDVTEVQCEPQARVECSYPTEFVAGKKCELEYQHYDYKDCSQKVTTRIDCKKNSVNSCKPIVKTFDNGQALFTGEVTCTPLFYEDCVVVDDAVGGCSRAELDQTCTCTQDYDPVCAGGLLYENVCMYECAKKEAECAAVQGFPAVGDIAECVAQDNKGIENRDAIKKFRDVLFQIEAALGNLPTSRVLRLSTGAAWEAFTEDEYKLLVAIVNAKEYVEEQCSIENGQCDLTKLEALINELKQKFFVVEYTGQVSGGYLQAVADERDKFDVVAKKAEEVQEKLALNPVPKDCTCSDFTNKNGVGKCQQRVKIGASVAFGGHVACYVNLPTSCSDVVQSATNPGLYLSAEACDCSKVEPNNVVALESCGLVPLGRTGTNRLQGVRPRASASTTEPICRTPFQIKWADYVEVEKNLLLQDVKCEVKSHVDCKKVSVKKCAQVEWKECNMRPVQQCEAVIVSEPSQEKVHQRKCITGDDSDDATKRSSSSSRAPTSSEPYRSGSSQSQIIGAAQYSGAPYKQPLPIRSAQFQSNSVAEASGAAPNYPYSAAQASRAPQNYPSKSSFQESDYYGEG